MWSLHNVSRSRYSWLSVWHLSHAAGQTDRAAEQGCSSPWYIQQNSTRMLIMVCIRRRAIPTIASHTLQYMPALLGMVSCL